MWNMSRQHSLVGRDRKSTRLNSSHVRISYAVFCLKKKNARERPQSTSSRVALHGHHQVSGGLESVGDVVEVVPIRADGQGINSVQRFFFNDTATTEIYTLSLHDALPI